MSACLAACKPVDQKGKKGLLKEGINRNRPLQKKTTAK